VYPAAATAAAVSAAFAAPAAAASAGDRYSSPMEATHEQRLTKEQVTCFSRVHTW